jgi:hypothetical protein
MKTLFAGAAALTLLLAIGWTFFPAAMLSWWSVRGDEITVYVARRYGCLLFGYTVILWLGRSAPASPARTAILAGGMVVTVLMAVVSLVGALTGVVGAMIWSAVAIEVVLAAAFAYHYVTAR